MNGDRLIDQLGDNHNNKFTSNDTDTFKRNAESNLLIDFGLSGDRFKVKRY